MTTTCTDKTLSCTPCPADVPARSDVGQSSYVRIGPIEVKLRSEMPEAAEDFAVLYRRWLSDRPTTTRVLDIEVKAQPRSWWNARRYAILGDGQPLFDDLAPEEVFPYLEWGINHRVLATCGEYLQLHAAVLAHKGMGILLVGQSGCGKSTLTAMLTARGWGYLSDEFALIDPQTLRVHPYPKALCIKAGSFKLVEKLGLPVHRRRPYIKAFKGRVGYVSPHDVNTQTTSLPIRLIVFPRYTGSTRTAAYPVPLARAAFAIAADAFNRELLGQDLIPTLTRLVRRAKCITLEPGPPDETAQALEAALPGTRI